MNRPRPGCGPFAPVLSHHPTAGGAISPAVFTRFWVANGVLHLAGSSGFHNNVILIPLKDNHFVIRLALDDERYKEETEDDKNTICLPREYRNTNEIPLGLQWIFTWNFLKFHHFYTNNPTEPELTKMKKKQSAVGKLWESPVAS